MKICKVLCAVTALLPATCGSATLQNVASIAEYLTFWLHHGAVDQEFLLRYRCMDSKCPLLEKLAPSDYRSTCVLAGQLKQCVRGF
jgi:hypothetical protein